MSNINQLVQQTLAGDPVAKNAFDRFQPKPIMEEKEKEERKQKAKKVGGSIVKFGKTVSDANTAVNQFLGIG